MVSTAHSQPSVAHGAGSPNLFGQTLKRAAGTLRLWWQRHAQREQLLRLDGHLLRDIGLSRTDAELESAKAFWER